MVKAKDPAFRAAVLEAAFGAREGDPDYVAPKMRATEREALSTIQERLRTESAHRRGGKFRGRRV